MDLFFEGERDVTNSCTKDGTELARRIGIPGAGIACYDYKFLYVKESDCPSYASKMNTWLASSEYRKEPPTPNSHQNRAANIVHTRALIQCPFNHNDRALSSCRTECRDASRCLAC